MPYREPDPGDPDVLVGVELPGSLAAMREMAWVFAEEFARLGLSQETILALFRQPFHAGAHRAYQVLGDAELSAIVAETSRAWGAVRHTIVDAPEPAGPRRLPLVRQAS